MKYIMLETADGQKMPILFPEALVHADVANLMCRLVTLTMGGLVKPVSAGSINLTAPASVAGRSDTLDLEHNPLDGIRVFMGDAVSYMPDELLALSARKLFPDISIEGV